MRNFLLYTLAFLSLGIGSVSAYTVQPGDYLAKIGQKFGLSWIELWDLNPEIQDPDLIHVGQELRVDFEDELLGATLPVAGQTYTLAGSGITASATSITLTSLTIPQTGYKLLDSNFSDTFYITLEPGNSKRQEIVSCTTVTQNAAGTATLSGCSRGLLPFTPFTASTTYQFAHAGGSTVIFSDPPQLFNEFTAKGNAETITNVWTFNRHPVSTSTLGTPTTTYQYTTKQYVDNVVNQGAATSTEAVAGISELATQVEMASSTDLGANRPLVLQAKYATSSAPSSGHYAVISESDGNINQGWLDLTENFTWTGTHSFATTTITDLTITSTTITNLNVGTTSTDPLVNGGSADSLHDHSIYNLRVLGSQAYRYIMGIDFTQTDNNGSGSFLQANNGFQVTSGASNGNRSSLESDGTFDIDITTDWRLYIPRLAANATTNLDAFAGVSNGCVNAADGVEISDHAAIVFFDNEVLASVGNGTTQTTSSLATGATTRRDYRIEREGSNIRFYVNNTLTATLSTNLPDTTTNGVVCFTAAASNGSGARAVSFQGEYVYEEER